MKVKQRSKPMTFRHVVAACDAFDLMDKAGIPENLAIRSCVTVVNVFANTVNADASVYVSVEAEKLSNKKGQTILEHGSPRYELTRLFIKTHRDGKLSEERATAMAKKYWAVAIITKEEDERLRKMGLRSKLMEAPHERWASAGIQFATKVVLLDTDALSEEMQSVVAVDDAQPHTEQSEQVEPPVSMPKSWWRRLGR
jgi:hypothetical protein